jgi:hypothetical protein
MSLLRRLSAEPASACAAPNRNGAPGGQCSVSAVERLGSP